MPKKKRFTVEKHQKYGELILIKLIRDAMLTIDIELSNTYGKTHKISKVSEKAFMNLEVLKCEMDTLMMTENPPTPNEPRGGVLLFSSQQLCPKALQHDCSLSKKI